MPSLRLGRIVFFRIEQTDLCGLETDELNFSPLDPQSSRGNARITLDWLQV